MSGDIQFSYPKDPDTELAREIEQISEQIHKNYCIAYEVKHGKPYWTGGDYSKLDEPTKELDRIQARYFIKLCQEARRQENEAVISIINTMCVKETPHGTLCKANYNDFMELCKAIRSRMKPENR